MESFRDPYDRLYLPKGDECSIYDNSITNIFENVKRIKEKSQKGERWYFMTTAIIVIIGIIAVANLYEYAAISILRKKNFQAEKDGFVKLSTIFYKSFIPCIYDMRALSEAYENGLPRLNEIELCYYFSYPKEYVLDEKNNLVVNGVNLGDATKCCLMQFGYDVGMGYHTNYGIRYNLLKDHFHGRMVVDEYKFAHDFTVFGSMEGVEKYSISSGLREELKDLKKGVAKHLDAMTGSSQNAFKKFGYVLPAKYKAVYDDFQKNNYSAQEMEEKMNALYKVCREEFDKTHNNYNINKERQVEAQKERVGEFWAGYGASAEIRARENPETYKEDDIFYGSNFSNTSLLDRFAGEDKEIEEKYNLR